MAKLTYQARRSRQTREHILQGSLEAFADKGYYGTSIKQICEICGVEQPTIYHHFGSKEKLFKAVLINTHIQAIRDARLKIDRSGDLRTEILSIFEVLRKQHEQSPEILYLLFSLVYSSPREIVNYYMRRYSPNFRNFIKIAFKRNPPAEEAAKKESLCIDIFQSYLLSLTAIGLHNDREPRIESSIDHVLGMGG